MSFFKKHKYYLLAFLILLLIAGVSGSYYYTTQNTWNKIQNHSKEELSNPIIEELDINTEENNKKETQNVPSPSQGEGQDEVKLKQTDTQNTKKTEEITIDKESEIINPVTLIVADEEYTTELKEGITVYTLMQNLSASSVKPFIFETKNYGAGMGHFVTGINGIKNDLQAGKYWIYYVNGESAKIGISNYIIKKGDVIEWKYENT